MTPGLVERRSHGWAPRAGFAFTVNACLFAWFAPLGLDKQEFRRRVHIAAAICCFPGRAVAGRLPQAATAR